VRTSGLIDFGEDAYISEKDVKDWNNFLKKIRKKFERGELDSERISPLLFYSSELICHQHVEPIS
jgi:hypothetical protein